MEFSIQHSFSIQAQCMYAVLNEITDIDNEHILNSSFLDQIIIDVVTEKRERLLIAILINLYSSEEGAEKYKNTIDVKQGQHINTIFGILSVFFSKLNIVKVQEHYSNQIEELREKVETGVVSEGDYLYRCAFIQSFINFIKRFNEMSSTGYILSSTIITGDEIKQYIKFVFVQSK